MAKELEVKISGLVKDFLSGIEKIEKDTADRRKDVDHEVEDYTKAIALLKAQGSELEKAREDVKAKLALEMKKVETLQKEVADELVKYNKLNKDLAQKNEKSDDALRTIQGEADRKSKDASKVRQLKEEAEGLNKDLKDKTALLEDKLKAVDSKLAKIAEKEKELALCDEEYGERQLQLNEKEADLRKKEKSSITELRKLKAKA